jgi:hypothetical protein
MKFYPKFLQNIGEGWLRRHAKAGHEKLFEYHCFFISRLRNNLLPGSSRITFGEVVQR